jgi:CHAT domain-containing protein
MNISANVLFNTLNETSELPSLSGLSSAYLLTVFDEIKDEILQALTQGDHILAENWDRLGHHIAAASGEAEHLAQAHWCSGLRLLQTTSRLALRSFDQAFAYYHNLPPPTDPVILLRLQLNRAPLLARIGDSTAAIAAMTEAEEILSHNPARHDLLLSMLLNRSEIESRAGDYRAMLISARRAEDVAQEVERLDIVVPAQINQAVAALFLADLNEAKSVLERAEVGSSALGQPAFDAQVAVNKARLAIFRDDPMAALRLLERARTGYDAAGYDIDRATVSLEEAYLYSRLQLTREARRSAIWATQAFRAAELSDEQAEAYLLAVGLSLSERRPNLRNIRALLTALESCLEQASPHRRLLARAYGAHPILQSNLRELRRALQDADAVATALATLAVPFEQLTASLIAAKLAASLGHRSAVHRYEAIIAEAQNQGLLLIEQQAQEGIASISVGLAISAALRRAADIAADIRRRTSYTELKAHALNGHQPLYGRLISSYLEQGHYKEAFSVLLEARGSLWAELSDPGIGTATNPEHEKARMAVQHWQNFRLYAIGEEEQTFAEQKLAEVIASLRLVEPSRSAQSPPDPDQVLAALPIASVGLEYLVVEKQLLVCIVTRDQDPIWVQLGPVDPVLAAGERLAFAHQTLQSQPSTAARYLASVAQEGMISEILSDLNTLLIEPLVPWFRGRDTLLISPESILADLPWAAFVDQSNQHSPYLAQRYQVLLTPTLVTFALKPCPPARGTPVICANLGEPPLVHQEREIASLRNFFSEARYFVPAKCGDLQWTEIPRLLHISAHGRMNAESPILSTIELADGSLLLADILHLSLDGTQLVMLTACETSSIPADGGIALAIAGAFLVSGASAVLAGLWKIDDEATVYLIEELYSALHTTGSLGAALRQAQHAVRERGFRHPYYWAALQPIVRSLTTDI